MNKLHLFGAVSACVISMAFSTASADEAYAIGPSSTPFQGTASIINTGNAQAQSQVTLPGLQAGFTNFEIINGEIWGVDGSTAMRRWMLDGTAIGASGLFGPAVDLEQIPVPISDVDGDGTPDLSDPCPADPLDECDADGSVAAEVDSDTGGTAETQDGTVVIDIDPGDLAEDTIISVTKTVGNDPEVDLTIGTSPGLGQGLAFYDLQPEGIQFASDVTVTIKADVTALNQNQRNRLSVYLFTDTNGDGVADQFVEVDLVTCSIATELDGTVIASCNFQLLHFSEYAVIVPLDTDGDGIADNFYPELDACPLEDASGFDVDDNGCIDSYSGLTDLVGSLVTEGVISTTMQNSLLSKVANAQASADRTSVCAAINELEAFKNQVAAQTGKKISADAAMLVSVYVDSVIAVQLAQLPVGSTCL